MSLLRHRDKSFRNIAATWGGLRRSRAALICSAGKKSPLCPPQPCFLPGQSVSRGATGGRHKSDKNWAWKGQGRVVCFFFFKASPCSRLFLDTREVGMGLLGDRCDPSAPGHTALPRLPAQGIPEVRIAFPCAGSGDGYVRQNQITPKYGLDSFFASRPNTAL